MNYWINKEIGDRTFSALNLDHPEIENRIMGEMSEGISVYYDTRWKMTDDFCDWLIGQEERFEGRDLLVIGAGVGLETVVLASMARRIYLNDLAPISLELCAEQLEQNGLTNYQLIPGDYTRVDLPEADLAVGCFVIYNRETSLSARAFLDRFPGEVLFVNPPMPPFPLFLKQCNRPHQPIMETTEGLAIHFPRILGVD